MIRLRVELYCAKAINVRTGGGQNHCISITLHEELTISPHTPHRSFVYLFGESSQAWTNS